jgi:hypothetical protein
LGLGESIKRDHDEYRRFFAKLNKTKPSDAKLRELLLADFKVNLYAHHDAEGASIFPSMQKIPELHALIFELEMEHADMKRHFEALSKERFDTEIWIYKLAPLYDVMHAHWLKEEEIMIPFGPDYFSEAEWVEFGRRFDEKRAAYLKTQTSS